MIQQNIKITDSKQKQESLLKLNDDNDFLKIMYEDALKNPNHPANIQFIQTYKKKVR